MHEIKLNPLKMDDSYVMFYSAPTNPPGEISDIILNGERINDNKFMNGIHYGPGFMDYHFNEFSPALKSLAVMRGHMGVFGTQMLYDKESGTVVVCSFGSTDYTAGSVRTVIKILSIIKHYEKNV